MTTTTKTILIVGGVAVGAYVLLELLKPKALRPVSRPTQPTDVAFVSGLLDFGARILTSVTNGPGQTGDGAPGSYSPYAPGSSTPGPWAPFDGNSGIDPNTGGVVLDEGETYGPSFGGN